MATSTHFKDEELRCPCCGLNNVKIELLSILEKARIIYGKPLIINSASRCPKYNQQISGIPGGAHITGEAVDIACHFSQDRFKLIQTFFGLGINRLGIAKSFLHIDISDSLPQTVFWMY